MLKINNLIDKFLKILWVVVFFNLGQYYSLQASV